MSKTNATIRLAPELSPSTSGPAKGFLKSVCISKPAIDNAAPANTQVTALGTLSCQIILAIVSDPSLNEKMVATTFASGIDTLPIEILVRKRRTKATPMI